MFIVDDPLLALLVRFVSNADEPVASNEEFIKRQVQTMQAYVAQFPQEQRSLKSIEWIEQHAERYRREWQKRAVTSQSTKRRCEDCPLKSNGTKVFCDIHEQWLYHLQCYLTDEITTEKYIKNALRLLSNRKKQLRHRLSLEVAKSG